MSNRLHALAVLAAALCPLAACRLHSDAAPPGALVWFADERPPLELAFGFDLPRLGDLPSTPPASEASVRGRWFRMKDVDQSTLVERLSAVPYLGGYKPPLSDTINPVHDRARAYEGLNFYTSGHAAEAGLADMEGRIVHRWTYPFANAFPDRAIDPEDDYFRRAHLFANGDILAIFEGRGLIKIDRGSTLLWTSAIAAHHDLDVAADGTIFVLSRERTTVRVLGRARRIVNDFISILDSNGNERRRISIFDALARSRFAPMLRRLPSWTDDVLHTNTIRLIRDPHAPGPAWGRSGNILISLLMLNAIAVVNPDTGAIVQAWTGQFRRQHDPRLLDDGDILFFDNQGLGSQSRVIEFDPVSNEVRWRYGGTAAPGFFSRTCGAVQRLPNGNTLITESDSGRAFEITTAGEIVWEFDSPHRVGRRREYVAALLAMTRVSRDLQFDLDDRLPRVDSGPGSPK